MFYAHFVLAKKGPLSRIWLAAHWDKKLTKAHVFETSIEQSVDGILQPKVKMALRTSGHLLLGVVRIYSRKAKYLLADCNEAFVKIKMAFRPGMSIDVDLPLASDGGIENREAAVNAITLPEIFHDFDTQIQVNGDGSSEMDLILNGGGSDDVDVNTGNVFQSSVTRVEEITMREDFGVNSTLQLENVDDGFGEIHDELGDVVGNHSTSFNNNINHQPLDFDDLSSFGFPTPTNLKKKLPPSESENIEDESLLRGDNSKASVAVVEEDGEISKDNNSIAIHDSLGVDKEVGLFEDTPEETAPTLPETSKDHHPHLDATDAEDNLTTTDMEDDRPSHVFEDTDDHPPHVFDDTDDHFGSAAATGMDDSAGLDHSISDHEEDIIEKDDELSKKDEEHRNVVEAESFALAPVDATMLPAGRKGNGHGLPFPSASINGQPSSSSGVTIVHKRKRKLVVDEVKAIAGEEMKAQLSDTSDIVCSLDLAPPTKRLMLWKESGGVDKLFLNQCKQTTSSSSTISLNNLFPNSISSVNIQDLLENCYSSSGSFLGGCSAALFLHAFYSQKLQLVLVPEYESYNRVDDVHGTLMDVVSRNVKKNEKLIPSLKLSLKTKGTIVGSSQSTNEPEDGYADNDDGMADYGADPTDSGEYQTGTDDYHHEDDLNFGDDRPTNNFNNNGDGDDFGSNNNSKSPQYTPDGVLIIPRVHKKRGRPSNKTLQEIQERQEKASDLNSEMTDMSSFSKDAKRVRREEEGVEGDQLSITNEKFMKESNNDHDESGISNDTSRRGGGGEVVTEELNITCGGATSGIASSIVSSSGGTHFVNGATTKTHSEENHQEEGEMTRLKRHNLLSPDNEENLFVNHSSLLNNTNSTDIVVPNEADEKIVGIHQKEDETSEQYEDRVLNTRAKHLIVTLRGRFNTSVRGQEEKFSFNDLLINTEDGSTKQKRKRVAQSFYSLLVLQKLNAVHLSQEEGLLGVKSDYLLQKSSISAPILIRKGVNFAQTTLLL